MTLNEIIILGIYLIIIFETIFLSRFNVLNFGTEIIHKYVFKKKYIKYI